MEKPRLIRCFFAKTGEFGDRPRNGKEKIAYLQRTKKCAVRHGESTPGQQAADHLNVSRPFLIKLLEGGDIPFTKTGRHRRIRAEDLFAYKDKRDGKRADALSGMARLGAEKGYL